MQIITRNKKVIALLTIMVISIGVLSGCGQSNVGKDNNGIYINKEYTDKDMVKIDGSKYKYDKDNSVMEKDIGVGVEFGSEHIRALVKNGILGIDGFEGHGYKFTFYSDAANELINSFKENMTPEEDETRNKKIEQSIFNFAEVIRVPKDSQNSNAKKLRDDMEKNYKNIETLATLNEYTYYLAYNTDFSKFTLTDKEKADIKKLIDEIELFKKGICIYPAVENEKSESNSNVKVNENINKFKAKTLEGKEITEDSFKDYDITMINIWATYCGSCKDEMKELAKLYESLPKNVNMTTICTDAEDEAKLAKEIIDSSKGKFKVIIPDDNLKESLINKVNAVPTTVFVDKDGNLIGDPIVGAPGKEGEVATEYMKEINKRLESIGK